MRGLWRVAGAVLAGLVLSAGRAHAGPSDFIWVTDSTVMPERSVELEQWVTTSTRHEPETAVRWMPVVALTDQVELALPVEITWSAETKTTQLDWWGGELRWRLAPSDPLENCAPVTPLLRLAVFRLVSEKATRVEGNGVLTRDLHRLHLGLDVQVQANLASAGTEVTATTGLGASYHFTDDLHAGVELFGEKHLKSPGATEGAWLTGGPDFSYRHGRFWLTAGILFGFDHAAPQVLPRLKWAIAF